MLPKPAPLPLVIRRLTIADLGAVDELRRLAGWNQTQEDWARLLALEPDGCFLGASSGQVVGTVTTTTYGSALAWLGMMLVHPDFRRQGIGMQLMRAALDFLSDRHVATVRLDATPAGHPLYLRLGFAAEWPLTRWQRPLFARATEPVRSPLVRELSGPDWPAALELDHRIFGVPRERLLRSLAQDPGGASLRVWPADGPLRGWALLRRGANARYLGPLICPDPAGARALLEDLLVIAPNSALTWDIPDQNLPARAAAREFGFAPVRPLTRMRLGPNPIPEANPALYAIADPALG